MKKLWKLNQDEKMFYICWGPHVLSVVVNGVIFFHIVLLPWADNPTSDKETNSLMTCGPPKEKIWLTAKM